MFAGMLDLNGPGAQRLRQRGSDNLQLLQLDVTDGSQVEAAHRRVSAEVGPTGLWGLVNNAGILHCPADAELHPLSVYRRCMQVNFMAAVNMCQVFLPLLRRSRGRVVNVCSMAGRSEPGRIVSGSPTEQKHNKRHHAGSKVRTRFQVLDFRTSSSERQT